MRSKHFVKDLALKMAHVLHCIVAIHTAKKQHINPAWWQFWRLKFIIAYLLIAVALLIASAFGHLRQISQVGSIFGGFTWTIDPDSSDGDIVVISIPPQLPPFQIQANSVTNNTRIVQVNHVSGRSGIIQAYQHAHSGASITYTAQNDAGQTKIFQRPASLFTLDMWWQTFGLASLAGLCWLIVGAILLITSKGWTGAVEGITMLPPASLLLLYSHWGDIHTAYTPDAIVQLIWIPSFALLGAAFIHLSLTYRPETLRTVRRPRWLTDGLPYAPLVAILAYEWYSFLFLGHVPMRTNFILSLGYAVIGGVISLFIGATSLLHIASLWPTAKLQKNVPPPLPLSIRHYIGDLLTLWIGGIGLGFCFGVLPILITGQTLVSLPTFYVLAAVFPLILLYAIRSLRLMTQLDQTLQEREWALREQQQTAQTLQQTNVELQYATSLLLHADAHLRSLLSQRIHDQPKQQALRIRSLLGHWQHKLRLEAERNQDDRVAVQPIIEALGKVRKISEELEGDLRGLQLLVEDVYQRRSLGLRLHLEKLIAEDLPMLHPESSLKLQADLWALDAFSTDLEQTEEGEKIAEAISYTITQALLNIYNHAGASHATVSTSYQNDNSLLIQITDDGHGFDPHAISPEKTSLFKAQLKVREAHGTFTITSIPGTQPGHGTTITLQLPLPNSYNITGIDGRQTLRNQHQKQEKASELPR